MDCVSPENKTHDINTREAVETSSPHEERARVPSCLSQERWVDRRGKSKRLPETHTHVHTRLFAVLPANMGFEDHPSAALNHRNATRKHYDYRREGLVVIICASLNMPRVPFCPLCARSGILVMQRQ